MLIALSQSPITAKQFFEWNEQLQKDEILVREIIDIDTNYMEDETTGPSAKQKNAGETDKDEGSNETDDEDFNPTYPYRYDPNTGKKTGSIQDRYSKYLKECESILDKYNPNKLDATLKLYLQGDPRGCHVWIYKASDDPKGRVDCIYNSIGTACYE